MEIDFIIDPEQTIGETRYHSIKLHRNGEAKPLCSLKDLKNCQDISQVKRRILMKLDIPSYDDKIT
jgi:hypothetical protein